MIFFTADLHFGHENIIRSAHRPYQTAEDMDMALIGNWNSAVSPADEVYILGDLTLRGPQQAMEFLRRLNGRKYLVRGNHDQFADRATFDKTLFQWVRDYHKLFYLGYQFILFHYPIVDWDQRHHGAIHLHGHQHNQPGYNIKNAETHLLRYDVGVDANGMSPVSAEQIISFLGLSPKGAGRPREDLEDSI